MIKILIADYYPVITKGIEYLTATEPKIRIIGSAHTKKSLFKYLTKFKIDALVLDVNMPTVNGFSIIKEILNINPKIKIIVFSDLAHDVYAQTALNIGAYAFLHKSSQTQNLLNIILSTKNKSNAATQSFKPENNLTNKLSFRESQVLKLIQDGHKNKDIAKRLKINEKTVSTYKSRLMKKLNVSNLIELIKLLK